MTSCSIDYRKPGQQQRSFRQTFASFDDLVAELSRQLGALLEQRAVVAVEVYGRQAADEAGTGPDVTVEVWRTGARRQSADVQLVTDVEMDRVPPVTSATPSDVITSTVVVTADVRSRSVVDT